MIAGENYIDYSVAAVASIDTDRLEASTLGSTIGEDGSEFTTRSIGLIEVLKEDVYLALKLPRKANFRDEAIEIRLQQELEAAARLLDCMPEVRPQLPQFMAMLAIGDDEPVSLLTEDVSRAGELAILPLGNNQDLGEAIEAAFANEPDIKAYPHLAGFTLSFIVGDQPKLLDFTPPPVTYEGEEPNAVYDRIYDLIFETKALTVNINPDSALAQSLAELY